MRLIEHARRELMLIPEDSETITSYLKILEEIERCPVSNRVMALTLGKLVNMHHLTPLTDNPDEWILRSKDVTGGAEDTWQSIRNAEAFSRDGGKTYHILSDRPQKMYESESYSKSKMKVS